jgi:protein TIF31
MELVQEIHQLLMDREETCHRTCFSLQLNGQTLDNFAELKTIDGLKDGSVVKESISRDSVSAKKFSDKFLT